MEGETERVLMEQASPDLVDPFINTKDQTSEASAKTDLNLQTLILYTVPMGMGVIILLFSLVCATVFCLNPARFQELIKCLKRNREVPQLPTHSVESLPLRSTRASPSASRAVIRSSSPARSLIGNRAVISSF